MNPEFLARGRALAALLRVENAALARGDYRAAASMVAAKEASLAALAALPREAGAPDGERAALARELAGLAAENGRALARALDVQRRVMGVIVQAVRRRGAPATYGAAGRMRAATSAGPCALLARA